ncbi:hypothetical protein CEXT_427571 [Caerostris extrusa]|uniref:Uncharacterized protein n=1 Tax=Caerostris extrusa TaxID=172846 RepID=A0AAV4RD52_CAEEX|nr:hypothetical protein CEXT_427571 [Caerostris extrusa]
MNRVLNGREVIQRRKDGAAKRNTLRRGLLPADTSKLRYSHCHVGPWILSSSMMLTANVFRHLWPFVKCFYLNPFGYLDEETFGYFFDQV